MDKIPIGFELEYETTAEKFPLPKYVNADNRANNLLGARGGSIHLDMSLDRGFEFSSPVTMSGEHLYAGSIKWRNYFRQINKKTKAEARSNCGLHIHIDKRFLTLSEIAKMNYFIFSNEKFISLIAGRKAASCHFDVLNVGSDILHNGDKKNNFDTKGNDGDDFKFRRFNVGRKKTVEMRMFASTTKYKVFLMRMQFALALVEFVKNAPFGIKDFVGNSYKPDSLRGPEDKMASEFRKFVSKNYKKYRYLYDFLSA